MKFVVIFLLATIASIVSPVAYATDAFLVNCPHAGQTPTAGTLYTCAVSFNGAGTFEVLNASDGQVGSLALAYSNANAYPSLQIATLDVIFPTAGQYHTRTTSVAGVVNNPPFTVIAGSNPPLTSNNTLTISGPASAIINVPVNATANAMFGNSSVANYAWTDITTGVGIGSGSTVTPIFTTLGIHTINVVATSVNNQTLNATWAVNVVFAPQVVGQQVTNSPAIDGLPPIVQLGMPSWFTVQLPVPGNLTIDWGNGFGYVQPSSQDSIGQTQAHLYHIFPAEGDFVVKFRLTTLGGVVYDLPSMIVRVIDGAQLVVKRYPNGNYAYIGLFGADGRSAPDLCSLGLFVTLSAPNWTQRSITFRTVPYYRFQPWWYGYGNYNQYQYPQYWYYNGCIKRCTTPSTWYGCGNLGWPQGYYWPY